MDIEANEREQAEVAADIMATWDACPDDGRATADQLDTMYTLAYRLAELVQAAHEWKLKHENA